MIAEWPDWYGPAGQGDARGDLSQRTRPNGLPMGLVALESGAPVGTVALDQTSYGAAPGEAPWLTGLVVCPGQRGRGIASALVARAEAAAASQGFAMVHSATIAATGLLLRRGWVRIRRMDTGHDILRRTLI